jgi:hypothetical protein
VSNLGHVKVRGTRVFVPAGREHAMTTDRQPDHPGREPEAGERRRSLNGRPRTTIALDPAALTDSGRSVDATEPSHQLRVEEEQ